MDIEELELLEAEVEEPDANSIRVYVHVLDCMEGGWTSVVHLEKDMSRQVVFETIRR